MMIMQHLLTDLQADADYAQDVKSARFSLAAERRACCSPGRLCKPCSTAYATACRWPPVRRSPWSQPRHREADRFVEYQRAGVNRISIGVQSFSEPKLQRLGRIHGPDEAKRAAHLSNGAWPS